MLGESAASTAVSDSEEETKGSTEVTGTLEAKGQCSADIEGVQCALSGGGVSFRVEDG